MPRLRALALTATLAATVTGLVSATAGAAQAAPALPAPFTGHLVVHQTVGTAETLTRVTSSGHGATLPEVVDGTVSYSPGGKSFAYGRVTGTATLADGSQPSQIVLHRADGTEKVLTPHAQEAYDPSWSPDGKTIAYAGSDGLHLITVATGSTRYLAGTRNANQPSFAGDSHRLAYFTFDGDTSHVTRVFWIDTRSGATHQVGQAITQQDHPSNTNRRATWSPDGTWIAFNTLAGLADSGDGVAIVHPDGSDAHRLIGSAGVSDAGPVWVSGSALVVGEHTAKGTITSTKIVEVGLDGTHRTLFTVKGAATVRGYTRH